MLDHSQDDSDSDPTLEQEFFIGGWDPYVVELTRLKRNQPQDSGSQPVADRRTHSDRRKS